MFWRKWQQQNDDSLIGLDISSDCIKILKLKSKKNPYVVENFFIAPLPAGAIVKDEIKDHALVAGVLKDSYKQSGLTTKNVAFAIRRSAAIIKNITISNRMTLKEIESRAWIEAERHFPDLVGSIYLDFATVGPSPEDPNQTEVILVACRKEHMDPYLEVIKMAGLKADVVEVNSYALTRALEKLIQETQQLKTVALLNLDFALSTLVIVQNNKMLYAHDQSFEGHRFMAQTQELRNKINNDQSISFRDFFKEKLSAHLRHTMHFFYSSRPDVSIQQIVLSGDCATIPELTPFIKEELGLDTIVANPFINLTLGPFVNAELLQQYAPALILCCGLSLSSIEYDQVITQ